MFNRIISEKIFCGLDIGAQKIKVVMLKSKDGQSIELLGAYETITNGFKDSAVSNLGELSESIYAAVNGLSKKLGVKVKEIHLGVGGEIVESRQTHTVIPLTDRGSKVIGKGDMKAVNRQAKLLGIKIEEEILHDLPQSYIVDDLNYALNPKGLYGRTLGVEGLMIVSNMNRIRNISKAVNHAGYDLDGIYFSSYVSSDVSLNDQEKLEGSILIDIGSMATSVLIFKDQTLKSFQKINIGGNDFTRSISSELRLPFDLAEEIKKSYAVALSSQQYPDEEILVKRENAYTPIKREIIYYSIEAEIEKLVENIYIAIKDSGYYDQINRGITVIGGGALLPGLIECISEKTNLKAKLGKVHINYKKSFGNAAMFTSAIGLAQGGMKNSFKKNETFSIENGSWMNHITSRFKELYHEYF